MSKYIQLHSVVITTKKIGLLPMYSRGTVVHVYDGEAYEVEFKGKVTTVLTVLRDQVVKVTY